MADQLLTAAMVHVFALAGLAAGIATLWAISRACRAARAWLRWYLTELKRRTCA